MHAQERGKVRGLTKVFLIFAPRDNFLKTIESSGGHKEDVCRVHLHGVPSGLPGGVLFGHIDNGALNHLEHALLDPFASHIPQLVDAGHGPDLVHLKLDHN